MADPNKLPSGLPHVERDIVLSVRRDQLKPQFFDEEEQELKTTNPHLWDMLVAEAGRIAHGDAALKQRLMQFGSSLLEAVERASQVDELEAHFAMPEGIDPLDSVPPAA